MPDTVSLIRAALDEVETDALVTKNHADSMAQELATILGRAGYALAPARFEEPEEVSLARVHAGRAEKAETRGEWTAGTYHASMATMYLAIAARKEKASG